MTAEQFKKARLALDLTRPQLAEKMSVSPRTIESWEQGDRGRSIPKWAILKMTEIQHLDVLKLPMTPDIRKRLEKRAKEKGVSPESLAVAFLDALLIIVVLFHLTRSPSNWSFPELKKTGIGIFSTVSAWLK